MENNRNTTVEIVVTSVIAFGTGTILGGLAKAVMPPHLKFVGRLVVGVTAGVAATAIAEQLTDYFMEEMWPIYSEIGQDISSAFKSLSKKEKTA